MDPSTEKLILLTAALAFFVGCGVGNKYEVVGRTQQDNFPNYGRPGTHTAVDYVLLHDGHKIYAHCDAMDIGDLDPNATCGFLPLRAYECTLQADNLEKATYPLGDLKCKDGAGHNVYLYVSKQE
jgi:hypothetical protein